MGEDYVELLKEGFNKRWIDVYENEEEFFLRDLSGEYKRDKNLSLLISMPNVVITSHQAFFTSEALNKIASDTCKNIFTTVKYGCKK